MTEKKRLVISDFNISNISYFLSGDVAFTPFNQVVASIIDKSMPHWDIFYENIIIWTRPESVISLYNNLLAYEDINMQELYNEVDEYCSLLKDLCSRGKSIFIVLWTAPDYLRGFGLADFKLSNGIKNVLLRMNLKIIDNLGVEANIFIFDPSSWLLNAKDNPFNPKLWYMAKIAFSDSVFENAGNEFNAAVKNIDGESRKLIVLDLDNTLWGGIVGDDGYENLKLGGHDYLGEAYKDFQLFLKSLKNKGIILALVSKNEEEVALEAINSHPEMVLKQNDFVGYRINWEDKAQNIVDLCNDLNLGLQSVVFIDDNPVERSRVKDALSDVFVPEMPNDPMLYKQTIARLNCFDTVNLTKEDKYRTSMYVSDSQRKILLKKTNSLEDWLKTLSMEVRVGTVNSKNLKRTVQLLNKTNQMNISTRRLDENGFLEWLSKENRNCFVFSVSDKFGDLGLTGVLSLEFEKDKAYIVDFILSCRVMGRKIEELMIHTAIEIVRAKNINMLTAKYIKTAKNKPCYDFFMDKSKFTLKGDNTFFWNFDSDYTFPDQIKVINIG